MKTIFAVRHRVAGIVSTRMYEQPPTEAQMAERKAEADEIYGCPGKHGAELEEQRKNGFPKNWVKVEEIKLLGADELDPYVPPRNPEPADGETIAVGVPVLKMTGVVGPARETMTISAEDVAEVPAEVLTRPEGSKKRRF